jgi:hypothetical protein
VNKYGYIRAEIGPQMAGDRVAFDLLLPRDAEKAVGIAAVCIPGQNVIDWLAAQQIPTRTAGKLSFRYAGIGDVFSQIPVETGLQYDDSYIFARVKTGINPTFSNQSFSISGKQIFYHPIDVCGHKRRIEGYYVDEINAAAGQTEDYLITIYLRYLKKP